MLNAKKELLDKLSEQKLNVGDIDYAEVSFLDIYEPYDSLYTEDPQELLKFLDREYDDGYGAQELAGTIVFKNKTWLEREEYDGAEWWVFRILPAKKI